MLYDCIQVAVVVIMAVVFLAIREYEPDAVPEIAEPLPVEPYYSMIDSFVHDMNYAMDSEVPREPFSWLEKSENDS